MGGALEPCIPCGMDTTGDGRGLSSTSKNSEGGVVPELVAAKRLSVRLAVRVVPRVPGRPLPSRVLVIGILGALTVKWRLGSTRAYQRWHNGG
jgi:hypothetical protein